jgi:hypothetical protein
MISAINDSTGEYLNVDTWKLLAITRKTDLRGRIHTNEIYSGKDVRVFVSDIETDLEVCKSYVLLPRSIYTEVRKTRIKGQKGDLLKVQTNGDIWTTFKDKYVKIFIREEKEDV